MQPLPSRLSRQSSKRWRHREGEEEAEAPPRVSSKEGRGRARDFIPSVGYSDYPVYDF